MPSAGKINSKLKKAFEGKVEARIENGSIVLSGELERWHEAVSAGMIAAGVKRDIPIVNNIKCTAEEPLHERKPHIEDTALDQAQPDVLIIGGGVIGCAVARELSRYALSVLLVEKEHDVAVQASGRGTGLVHSGGTFRRGTKKQWFTTQGNQKIGDVCTELGVPFKRCGQLIVYKRKLFKFMRSAPVLFVLKYYWRWCGFKDVRLLSGDEVRSVEPKISDSVGSALYFPSGGVICPNALTVAYAENSVQNGVRISFNTMVKEMTVEEGLIKTVATNRGTIQPRVVVNAAGLFCEDIATMAGDRFYSVHPIRGTTIVLNRSPANDLVKIAVSMLSGAFSRRKRSTGSIGSVLKTVHGNLIAGPFYVETINKEDYGTDKFVLEKAIEQAQQAVPALSREQVMTCYSGIGAATYNGDFIVCGSKNVLNIVHAAGIQFPGLTASPAIAEEVARLVVDRCGGQGSVPINVDFNPSRDAPPRLRDLDVGERASLIGQNQEYGVSVCHCEQVSRGEIIDAINSEPPCETIDGVKRRTRAGCGYCRGQRCLPSVLEILSTEKRTPPTQIRSSGAGSELVYGSTAAARTEEKKAASVPPLVPETESSSEIDRIIKIEEQEKRLHGIDNKKEN